MKISAEVEDIVFRNDENGYSVLRLKDYSFVAVGFFHYVTVGQELVFEGEMISNAKYGKQFKVAGYELVPPNSPAKIRAFIGSGLLHGIGPVTAARIVKEFGIDTLSILETDPSQLSRVKGISERKAIIIGEQYEDIKQMQSSIVYLQKFEISMNMAIKIYNHYKEKTIETVQTNPYKLIETIDGIGFLTADKIAKDLGINYAGTFRVRAGVVYTLKQSSEQDGNTFLPYEKLRLGVCRLLKIKMEQLEPVFDSVIRELCLDKYLTKTVDKKGVMLTRFYVAEKAIASRLCMLVADKSNDGEGFDSLIEHYQKVNNIRLHKRQIDAIKMACSSGASVITGGPGTGKTTIVKAILFIAESRGLTTQLLAPTGRAAKRMEETTGHMASTIHRALDIDYKGGGKGMFGYDDEENIVIADMVIVDEVSMCDCMLMKQLLARVMRGTKIVLVGDSDQLPSVGAGNVLADIIASGVVPTCKLEQIFRQTENSQIVVNAHRINNGEMPVLDNKSMDFYYQSAATPGQIKHNILGLVTDRIPKFMGCGPDRIQVLCPMKLGEAGMNSLNVALQQAINPADINKGEYEYGQTVFRVGDRVMQTMNNYNQEWSNDDISGTGVYNGDIGKVIDVNRQNGEVVVELEDGRVTTYTRGDLTNLVLAYAITVHKSQGCEFDIVVIPVTSGAYMILTRNLLYTAVTRAKKMVMLVGAHENIEKMVNNTYTKQRFTMLREFLIEMQKKAEDMFGE